MLPEAAARLKIDAHLIAAGWAIQNYRAFNPSAARGIALREVPLDSGRCDYLLLVDRIPLGVIEAKKEGTTLSTVSDQSSHYGENLPDFLANLLPGSKEIPFAYESTGVETLFRDERDPDPRSRRVFAFHQPEALVAWLAEPSTLRARLTALPTAYPLPSTHLRTCQIEAITSLEKSFAADRPRALIQMATGAGKTYTACAFTYRLIKFAGARRVLFLVDRSNLGKQAKTEFEQFVAPDTGRKFTEVYNVQHLTSNTLDTVARVTICTIQRLYSILRGEPEFDEDLDEKSAADLSAADARPKDVAYNHAVPIEAFDFIVTDECHRSIYGLWRQVLEYFDAHLVGLTAAPGKQTVGFFNQNLVMEYTHERAVAEAVASHTLVPEDALAEVIRAERLPQNNWDTADVRKLARRFLISPLATATCLRASGYFDWAHYQSWRSSWDAWVASLPPRAGGFAHPVGQALTRNGRPYIQLVLEALGSNRITTVDASRYLDLKAEHFEKLRGALAERPGTVLQCLN